MKFLSCLLTLCITLISSTQSQIVNYFLGDNVTVIIRAGTFGAKSTHITSAVLNWTSVVSPTLMKGALEFANTMGGGVIPLDPTKNVTVQLFFDFAKYPTKGQIGPLEVPLPAEGTIQLTDDTGKTITSLMTYDIQRPVQIISPQNGAIDMNVPTSVEVRLYNTSGQIKVDPMKNTSWIVSFAEINGNPAQQWQVVHNLTYSVKKNTNGDYTLTLDPWMNAPVGKPLLLMVGLNESNQTGHYNRFSVVGNGISSNNMFLFHKDPISLSVAKTIVPQHNVTQFEVNGGGINTYWWIVAEPTSGVGKSYALDCMPLDLSNKANRLGASPNVTVPFNWNTVDSNGMKSQSLPVGQYDLFLVWTDSVNSSYMMDKMNKQRVAGPTKFTVEPHASQTPIVINGGSQKRVDFTRGQDVSLEVETVFTELYFQFQEATGKNTTYNGTYTNSSGLIKKSFTPGLKTTVRLPVPGNLTDVAAMNVTRLYVAYFACDGTTPISQSFVQGSAIDPQPSNSGGGGSGKLSPGAIVGIVCAAVFVCGVGAWWFCMRNQGKERYQRLDP